LPTVDLVIKNAKIVTPVGVEEGGLAVDDGLITAISKTTFPPADQTIDAKGKLLMPGLIDAHVHFRDPGFEEKEDFETGTRSAAAGGITLVFDMPNTNPPVSTEEAFKKKLAIVKGKAVVDFALYGGAGVKNLSQLTRMAKAGAIAFKTYPCGGSLYEDICVEEDVSIFRVLEEVKKTGLPSAFHAEDSHLIRFFTEKLKKTGRRDYMAHPESRPNFIEAETIAKLIPLSKATGVHLHIAHVSTKEGVEIIRWAKAMGYQLTAETCPHYLLLTTENLKEFGPYAKIDPPLRTDEDRRALWSGLLDGTIDIITSDHAPHLKEKKDLGLRDIWAAPSGVPQIETTLPLLLTKVNENRLSITRLVEATSYSVSKIFGLYPEKGAIKVGSDADFVIVDPNMEGHISAEHLQTKAREVSLYDGWRVKGCPVLTVCRGTVIMENGTVNGKAGYGKFVRPQIK